MHPGVEVGKTFARLPGRRREPQRGSGRIQTPRRPPRLFANLVDAAFAEPLSPAYVSPEILGLGPVTGVGEAGAGLRVQKSGRTSGVTAGTVLATGVTVLVTYAGRGVARFRGQIATTFMAQPGDSGSLLVDEANRAVGLLFAGSDTATLHNPILPVLRAFGVDVTPAATAAAGPAPAGAAGVPAGRILGQDTERRLGEAVGRHGDALLGLPNVVGVGAGWKWVRGRVTRWPALVVLVRRKLPAGHLAPADRVPRALDGWVTDVIEAGAFTAFQRTDRVRPARPGVSISHVFGPTGTLGAVVFDKLDRPAILSNNHILANATNGRDGRAAVGDPILQPGGADGGTAPGDTIARLSAFVPLIFTK